MKGILKFDLQAKKIHIIITSEEEVKVLLSLRPNAVISSSAYNKKRPRKAKMQIKKIKIIKSPYLTWYDLEKPTEQELKELQVKFKFHPLDIQDCLSPVQRPKFDEYTEYLFLILRLPFYGKKEKVIAAHELDIFVGRDYLITVHSGRSTTLKEFVEDCEQYKKFREQYLGNGPGFLLYEILSRMFNRCYSLLDSIGNEIDKVEDKMFQGKEREIVEIVAGIKRNVLNFRKIMQAHRQVLRGIIKSDKYFLNLGGGRFNQKEILFDNLLEEIDNIWDILNGHLETITALDDTNQNLIYHRINQMMKTLTIVSAIFLPASLITQFFSLSYGSAPFTNSTLGIIGIFCTIILTSFLMVFIFKKKKWL